MRWIIQSFAAVLAGADREQRVARVEALAVQRDLDLARLPLQAARRCRGPRSHRPGAVAARRDLAVEVEVLERVILGVRRDVVVLRLLGHALRERPRGEHAVALEPQVPVQARAPCSWITKRGAHFALPRAALPRAVSPRPALPPLGSARRRSRACGGTRPGARRAAAPHRPTCSRGAATPTAWRRRVCPTPASRALSSRALSSPPASCRTPSPRTLSRRLSWPALCASSPEPRRRSARAPRRGSPAARHQIGRGAARTRPRAATAISSPATLRSISASTASR